MSKKNRPSVISFRVENKPDGVDVIAVAKAPSGSQFRYQTLRVFCDPTDKQDRKEAVAVGLRKLYDELGAV
jgi:hypothetical protein